jgi:cell wall-associated NlpC family hydrolase
MRNCASSHGVPRKACVAVEWRDLLALPFERANCYDLAVEVCRRAGLRLPPLPCNWAEVGKGVESEIGPALQFVGESPVAATQIGDLLIGDPEGKGYASHVAVLVEKGLALSTSVKAGPFARGVRRHPCDLGVWRTSLRAVE